MPRRLALSLSAIAALALATPAIADPPAHAPAHGWRAKHSKKHGNERHDAHVSPGGFQVVFDPERGVSIAVEFPGVVFHDDLFYRLHAGIWQKSPRPDGAWKSIAPKAAPDPIRKALLHPGPAKLAGGAPGKPR